MKENLYTPLTDPQFQKPYVDQREHRDTPLPHLYVHGGYEGTELRFCFFFPEKEAYQGRFFQFMAPAEGSETASIGRTGVEDKIGFALSHGAYFVESNMGTLDFTHKSDPTIVYRASAAAAEYSRVLAGELYGPHRPFGYIYGGSGGAFKTISCFENTSAWDGAVPYIHGSPMAIPNVFCARAYAKRVLRHKFPDIVDALEPGGSGDPYATLNEEESRVLREVTRLGFPLRSWFYYKEMDDGAFPVVAKSTIGVDASYNKDFWTVPGYEGANPNSSVHRDRIVCDVTVRRLALPGVRSQAEVQAEKEKLTGADSTWKRSRDDYGAEGEIVLWADGLPAGDVYAYGAVLTFADGAAAGLTLTVSRIVEDRLYLAPQYGAEGVMEKLALVKPGDAAHLDNSDYLAAQTFYRHEPLPSDDYIGWEQFLDADRRPIYPQRPFSVGPMIARSSCGSLQEGGFNGKMIVVAATMDESAFPWQIDWYRNRVRQYFGAEIDQHYRVYFFDNAFHDDQATTVDDLHLISYLGGLHQALLDLAAWVEKDIQPPCSSGYSIREGQVELAATAHERGGIQPLVELLANGSKKAVVKPGERVFFGANIDVPEGAGDVTRVEWSLDGEAYHPGDRVVTYVYDTPGTHFAVVRVWSQRDGTDEPFTQVPNLSRARVVVE